MANEGRYTIELFRFWREDIRAVVYPAPFCTLRLSDYKVTDQFLKKSTLKWRRQPSATRFPESLPKLSQGYTRAACENNEMRCRGHLSILVDTNWQYDIMEPSNEAQLFCVFPGLTAPEIIAMNYHSMTIVTKLTRPHTEGEAILSLDS